MFLKPLRLLVITILLARLLLSIQASYAQAPLDETLAPELTEFGLLSPTVGWLRLGQRLYWADTGGLEWLEVTPANRGRFDLQAVWFADTRTGWLALTQLEPDGAITYALAQTVDGGQNWIINPLPLFVPGDPAALAGAIYLHFIDTQTGWLVIKQATSPNFSAGVLFRTGDGGRTWIKLNLPGGGPVYFINPQVGWMVAGSTGFIGPGMAAKTGNSNRCSLTVFTNCPFSPMNGTAYCRCEQPDQPRLK
jgi:photosystem II stability/assembly factor-like uncharacterized protein